MVKKNINGLTIMVVAIAMAIGPIAADSPPAIPTELDLNLLNSNGSNINTSLYLTIDYLDGNSSPQSMNSVDDPDMILWEIYLGKSNLYVLVSAKDGTDINIIVEGYEMLQITAVEFESVIGDYNLTQLDTTPPTITISSPQNDTINDTTPDLNFTISEVSNITYNWNSEGNISGCRQCTSYNTTYGEYANASEQNLVLAMHFNENNGSTAYDDSSNKNGTIYGATWTTGKFGNALDFDGNDYVRVPDNDSLDFSLTDDFTIMVWFKTSGGSGNKYIFDKSWSSGTQYRAYHLFMTGGKLRFMIHANGTGTGANTSNIKSSDLYNDSQWHHIAIVRNTSADKVFMYMDGAYKKNAADNTVEDSENPGNLTIGSYRGTSGFFNGTVDELVFVKRALGASEISNIYNKTLPDDPHSVTVYAKDESDNQNSTTRWFSVLT